MLKDGKKKEEWKQIKDQEHCGSVVLVLSKV